MNKTREPTDAFLPPFTRRGLLRGVAALPVALAAARCADVDPPDRAYEKLPATREGSVLVAQLPRGPSSVETALRKLDLGWLKRGDSVLLKVASNSPHAHPATTSPDAVRGMVRALKDRGAGRVIVADQAGVQWVRYREGGRVGTRTTRDVLEENGLAAAARDEGAEVHAFDDEPFATGWFAGTKPAESSWDGPVFIPRIVDEVDHILYLPRMSAHAITGYTMALKIAVGWMRDDTRLEFHRDGARLCEKYAEVSHLAEIRARLRGAFFHVTHLQLDVGPDFGTVVPLPEALIVHSENVGDADAVGAAVLAAVDGMTPAPLDLAGVYPFQANHWNRSLVGEWGAGATDGYRDFVPANFTLGPDHDPALRRFYALEGRRPSTIRLRTMGTPLPPPVMASLAAHAGGLFTFEGA